MARPGRVYVNQSVSFPPPLLAAAKRRAANLGLNFSAYVQKCVERDLKDRPAIVFEERIDDTHLLVADDSNLPPRSARQKKEPGR